MISASFEKLCHPQLYKEWVFVELTIWYLNNLNDSWHMPVTNRKATFITKFSHKFICENFYSTSSLKAKKFQYCPTTSGPRFLYGTVCPLFSISFRQRRLKLAMIKQLRSNEVHSWHHFHDIVIRHVLPKSECWQMMQCCFLKARVFFAHLLPNSTHLIAFFAAIFDAHWCSKQ